MPCMPSEVATKQKGEMTGQDSAGCSIRVALQLEIPPVWANSFRTVDAGLRREITKQAARRVVWSGPYGEEFAPDKSASALPTTGRAVHDYREQYLEKECVGSN